MPNSSNTDILWHEVPTLYESTPEGHNYLLQVSEQGKAKVIFGNGKQGSRLPTGNENILATYRSGIGQEGNVETGQLSIMLNRQPGVGKVTNPIPGSGGTNPTTMKNARQVAPLSVKTLGRIVTFDDYEDFARTYPGIAKGNAKVLWNGHFQLIHLTIAATDGATVAKNSMFYQDLCQAIQKLRASSQPMQVDSFVPLFFKIEANIIVGQEIDKITIENEIKRTLSKEHSFANQTFGQTMAADSIIATIQKISGVSRVDLEALYLQGDRPQYNPILKANFAEWNAALQEIVPAQLLLLDPKNGISLKFINQF